MVQILPKENDWSDVGRNLAGGFVQGYQNRSDDMAIQKAISDLGDNPPPDKLLKAILGTKTHNPESKKTAFTNYLGVENMKEVQRHAQEQEAIAVEKNRIAALNKKKEVDEEALYDQYIKQGYPDHEAALLSNPNVEKSIKQGISRNHQELVNRKIRLPLSEQPQQVSEPSQPSENQQQITEPDEIANVEQNPGEAPVSTSTPEVAPPTAQETEWPELPTPQGQTRAEKEKWRGQNQTFNNKLLKEIKPKSQALQAGLIRTDRMITLNDTHKVANGASRLVIDPATNEPYPSAQIAGLVNKETQDFSKTLADFLIDAKNFFGARVTNFDLTSFKARLPGLMNTEEGRRLILEQMKIMQQLQLVHEKTLEDAIKHYGRDASYSDIQRIVDEKVEGTEQELISKMNILDTAAGYLDKMANDPKFKGMKLMQDPESGKFKAVRPEDINRAKTDGYKAW